MRKKSGSESEEDGEAAGVEAIEALLFDFMGSRMGVDVDQIAGMLDPRDEAAGELDVLSLHEMLSFRNERAAYVAPKVLLIRDDDGRHGVLIEQPEDIVSVSLSSIRPLPAILEASMKSGAVWGVALIGEEMVLLVDLHEVIASRMPEATGRDG